MASQLPKSKDNMIQKKLLVDSSTKGHNNSNVFPPTCANSQSDATPRLSFIQDAAGSVKVGDVHNEYLTTAQGVLYANGGYYGHYYPANQGYYVGANGMDFQYPVMQADNGSYAYLMPGFQADYFPYSPTSTTVVNRHYAIAGHNVYPPRPVFQQSIGSPSYYSAPVSYGMLNPSPYSQDYSLTLQNGSQGNVYNNALVGNTSGGSNLSSQSHAGGTLSNFMPVPNLSKPLEVNGSTPLLAASSSHVKHTQLKPAPVCGSSWFPLTKFHTYNQGNNRVRYQNNLLNAKPNNMNGSLIKQNQGPRTWKAKGVLMSGAISAGALTTDRSEKCNSQINRDQYNLSDFPTKYDHALFFIIKSYNEDDIHKSIKYNVWSSTTDGNKRLDNAYQEAQKQIAERGSEFPLFLFFSVNASGQFCGVAEMVGRVDFNNSMDFWKQGEWTGCFPVKWHIVKDVQNQHLRHIILENNDYSPVTISRDTQEVPFPQGVKILNIFKNFKAKTSIFDDFEYYEKRQKFLEDKKIRQSMPLNETQLCWQQMDELTNAFGSMNPSTVKNIEDPKLSEKVKEYP